MSTPDFAVVSCRLSTQTAAYFSTYQIKISVIEGRNCIFYYVLTEMGKKQLRIEYNIAHQMATRQWVN